jgi:N-sulfoglucosamine sulfohydrolase
MRRRLREEILASRDTGFVPEGMLTRMAGDRTAYEFARSDAYPLERILPLAERATARDIEALPDLIAALKDPHPVIRYWAVVGCLILEQRAAPAKDSLRARLDDDWADVRVAAAEAMAWLGDPGAALDTLADVLATGNLYEVLAAQNALEYTWRAGHIPLDAAQALLRARDFTEPAQRIPEFLLGLPADATSQAVRGEVIPGFQLAIAKFNWLECDDCDGVATERHGDWKAVAPRVFTRF